MPLKLNIIGRRRPGTTLLEHRRRIRDVHGELVLRFIRTDAENAPRRHVQNDVLGHPGTAHPADAIDEFWFDDEAAAHAHLSAWQAVLNESLIHPGLALAGSLSALIAREDVIHPGTI